MKIRIFMITYLCFLVLPGQASEETKTNAPEVICSSASEKRKLQVVKEGSGCKVNYTKDSITTAIGSSSKSETDFCTGLVEKVKTKLVDHGFDCKEAL
ncbi:MAG: hypothetical protein AABY64_01430 [Bdellovibrionota bacterium]